MQNDYYKNYLVIRSVEHTVPLAAVNPVILYRYLNEQYGLQVLQEGMMKVGRLLELNDPADCQPRLINAPAMRSEREEDLFVSDYLREIYENVGVVCFSAQLSDPVIWSHYADSHRGIALGYEINGPYGNNLQISKVQYQDERPAIDYPEAEVARKMPLVVSGMHPLLDKVVQNGFLHKATSWRYEREYRMFRSLGQCTMRGAHYFIKCPRPVPDCVVLGVRSRLTPTDVFRAIAASGTTINLTFKANISKATMHRTKHRIITPETEGENAGNE